jgi:hypothetical protein
LRLALATKRAYVINAAKLSTASGSFLPRLLIPRYD